MPKYSTGGVGSGGSESCELCGAEGKPLETETVAGATLEICPDCRSRHGEQRRSTDDARGGSGQGQGEDVSRKIKAVRNTARLDDARKGDASRWEEGTSYEDDPLPYLVRGYGDRVETARQDAGLTTADLAGELGVREADLIAVEQGRANSAGIGGSLIADIEKRLKISLVAE